jgi:hypothetical protein
VVLREWVVEELGLEPTKVSVSGLRCFDVVAGSVGFSNRASTQLDAREWARPLWPSVAATLKVSVGRQNRVDFAPLRPWQSICKCSDADLRCYR